MCWTSLELCIVCVLGAWTSGKAVCLFCYVFVCLCVKIALFADNACVCFMHVDYIVYREVSHLCMQIMWFYRNNAFVFRRKSTPSPNQPARSTPAAGSPLFVCVCVCCVCVCFSVFCLCCFFYINIYIYIYMSFEINPVLTNLDRVHLIIPLRCLKVSINIEFRKDSEAVRKIFRNWTAVFGSCFLIIQCFL